MAKTTQFLPAAFVLLLVVATIGETGVKMAEARLCESQSHKFHGTCLSESNCKNVCATEGFSGGDCRGVRRRCFCTRPC